MGARKFIDGRVVSYKDIILFHKWDQAGQAGVGLVG